MDFDCPSHLMLTNNKDLSFGEFTSSILFMALSLRFGINLIKDLLHWCAILDLSVFVVTLTA